MQRYSRKLVPYAVCGFSCSCMCMYWTAQAGLLRHSTAVLLPATHKMHSSMRAMAVLATGQHDSARSMAIRAAHCADSA